jgi:hypothetical protein
MNKDEKKSLYTLRWYLREHWGEELARREALSILGSLLEPEAQPENRPSASAANKHLLWCPFAQTDFPKAPTVGSYEAGYPMGAVVHFTAGRRHGLKSGIQTQIQGDCTYFVIDADGNIAQNFPLDSWGYHAGEGPKSKWPGLGEGVGRKLVGIEVQAAGQLTKSGSKYKSWFGLEIPAAEVRQIATDTDNQQQAGSYQKYTDAQEAALIQLLLWLYRNNTDTFSLDLVLGHDEVSGPQGIGRWRKNDPGGALSMTMKKFRAHLKKLP